MKVSKRAYTNCHLLEYIAIFGWKGRIFASTNRPAASLETSSSAALPASEGSKLSTNPSGGTSSNVARPATVLEQVDQLGHCPKLQQQLADNAERLLQETISRGSIDKTFSFADAHPLVSHDFPFVELSCNKIEVIV